MRKVWPENAAPASYVASSKAGSFGSATQRLFFVQIRESTSVPIQRSFWIPTMNWPRDFLSFV